MSTLKPGELLTYAADIERTGVVLDRAASPMSGDYGEGRKPLDFRVWVHREDGTFDKVRVVTRGKRKGETTWLGQFTPAGVRIVAEPTRSAESA